MAESTAGSGEASRNAVGPMSFMGEILNGGFIGGG
jgi:hypothetical protein